MPARAKKPESVRVKEKRNKERKKAREHESTRARKKARM
jgi:hypothetical protein